MLQRVIESQRATTADRLAHYREIGLAYVGVAVCYTLFFAFIQWWYSSGSWHPLEWVRALNTLVHTLIQLTVQALLLFAAPLFLLAFPGNWLPPTSGVPWEMIGQAGASLLLLVAFGWVAARQPTARRRAVVGLIFGVWVLAVPLLELIQMYTPIAVDELF